jgi:hypothetical protein
MGNWNLHVTLYRWACVAALLLMPLATSAQSFGTDIDESGGLPIAPPPAVPSGPFTEGRTVGTMTDQAIISSEEAYFTERDGTLAYSTSRTKVQYNEFILEADRMVIDFVSEEIQAEGNVLFTGASEFIKADRGRFNLGKAEGVAFGVNGQAEDFYFQVTWNEDKKGPGFRQINDKESIFRGTHFTTNPFPKPMWYIKASEIILVRKERIFLRNPVVVIRGVPSFWLPFYTRNLKEGSPWFNEFGYASRLGAYFRLGYRYIHRVKTPSWLNPQVYETRAHGLLDTYGDILAERGVGVGATYRYKFDYGRHVGYLQVYGLRDRERSVVGEDPLEPTVDDEPNRWIYRHKHNSLLANSLLLQWDADLASDPDVYVDVLDRFTPDRSFERGRLFEQRVVGAVTYRDSSQIARLSWEQKDRITRDYYVDGTDPYADDLEFDPDPFFIAEDEDDDDLGISKERYGTVTERAQTRFATRLLNLGAAPLYYRFEANAFKAKDSGFNGESDADDYDVQGLDAFSSLTNRLRFGPRTTWTNTVGFGGAIYDRDSDELLPQEELDTALANFEEANGVPLEAGEPIPIGSMRFLDNETYLPGLTANETDNQRSFNDVNRTYVFGDYTSRLNHRFTEFLDGYLEYRVRRGTDDSLGDFYERIGRTEARNDIYNFYSDRHWLTSGLNFYLRYPNLTTSVFAGENLQGDDDIYPNESKRYAGFNTGYRNPSNEFAVDFGAIYDERQIRDQADPNTYTDRAISPFIRLSYFPRHARYWAQLNIWSRIKLEEDPVTKPNEEKVRFDENEDEIVIDPTIGRRFGPKYRVQVGATYNTKYENWDRAGITIIRDLHDADLGLFLGIRNNRFEAIRDEEDETAEDYEYDIRFSIRFRINRDQPGLGSRSLTTLADLRREGYYVR